MAKVLVTSGDGVIVVRIRTDKNGYSVGECSEGCEEITDRGNFEDTIEAAKIHADMHYGGGGSGE